MKKTATGLLVLSSFFVFTTPAFAVNPTPIRTRLTEARLQICKTKQNVIENRMDSLTKLVANMEEKFDSTAGRVENFYTTKVVPSGKTVANYDTLTADIAAKKILVDEALTKAKTNKDSFSCDADSPRGILTQFRLDMQATKTALRNYRTSIKNLIVAVHSVAPSESPKPTQ